MDTLCLTTQLAAHLAIFISIMSRYNQLKKLDNRFLSLLAALLAGVSLSAALRIGLTWPRPITLSDYFESFIVVLAAIHVWRCGGKMSRILLINSLKPLA